MEHRKNILKGAGVLFVAALMVLSTVAATADTEDEKKIYNEKTCFAD